MIGIMEYPKVDGTKWYYTEDGDFPDISENWSLCPRVWCWLGDNYYTICSYIDNGTEEVWDDLLSDEEEETKYFKATQVKAWHVLPTHKKVH